MAIPMQNEPSDKNAAGGNVKSGMTESGKNGDGADPVGTKKSRKNKNSIHEKLKMRRRMRKLRMLAAIFLTLIALMFFTDISVRKPLRALAIGKVRAVSAEALNNAVLNVLNGCGFDKLCTLNLLSDEKSEKSGVYALQINSPEMNRIAADIAHEAQELIRRQGELGLGIPLGTATGIAVLTGFGPKIRVTFTPIGSVTSKISTKFSGAGINQTRYCAYLNLEAKVHIVLGTSQDTVTVNHTAALYETILVGAVPDTYTNIDSVDEALNLLPVN